ncbi:MAG: hypothetical protein OER12_04625 [Acidimicrobiia bacterium]|nr:hypothetical protein [Acidimicrobiia bacterium]
MSRPLHMRHNFPAVEALEAGGVDVAEVARLAPGVDPERLLVREARPWFEHLVLRQSAAIAFSHVVYMHSRAYRLPRAQITRLVVHELIHVSQWRQDGHLRFARRYLWDYLRGRLRRQTHSEAYLAIGYEVAARQGTASLFPD